MDKRKQYRKDQRQDRQNMSARFSEWSGNITNRILDISNNRYSKDHVKTLKSNVILLMLNILRKHKRNEIV